MNTRKRMLTGLMLVIVCIGLFRIIRIGYPGSGREAHRVEETTGFPEQEKETEVNSEAETLKQAENAIAETATPPEAEPAAGSVADKGLKHTSPPRRGYIRDEEAAEPAEVIEGPPKVLIASDLHVLARELTDGGAVFMKKAESDDGKTTLYSEEIVEAFLDQVLTEEPDALVLSGDLTFEGERLSHKKLARMLERVKQAGIQVLAIPGNHDINNSRAAAYFDSADAEVEDEASEPITAAEFAEIYKEYGYEQAISRDESSLSYIYPLRNDIWMMMLDTNQYDPVNLVDGDIRPETYEWMIKELDKAEEMGIMVVPVGHHNMLSVSRLYTRECMIRSRSSAIWLFGEHNLPLYLSGHLHVQRMKKYRTEPGMPDSADSVHEIVTSSLGMTPHQYGILTWDKDKQLEYQAERVDVESYAIRRGSQDGNLLSFSQYSKDWYYHVVEKQILKKLSDFPEDIMQDMAYIYADVLYHYGAAETMDQKSVETSRGYRMWERFLPGDKKFDDIRMMLQDMRE